MSQSLCGWLAPADRTKEQQEQHEKLVATMPAFRIVGDVPNAPTSAYLWKSVIKVLGKNTRNYPQEIGDCVSFGAKNVMEVLQCVEIDLRGEREQFHPIFPPFIYGVSRVQIGGGQISGDGSVGSWAADGAKKYGILRSDAPGCPSYSGSVAKSWGRSGPPKEFLEFAKPNIVKTTAPVRNASEAKAAILNGYPVTVASNVGYEGAYYTKNGKKFKKRGGNWGHQMCFIGVDDDGFYELNSWGEDAFEPPLNDEPPGGFWVSYEDADRQLSQDDSFAWSQFDGFPAQALVYDIL